MSVGRSSQVRLLAEAPVGPRLAALLAAVRLGGLSGSDCVEVMQAQFRQANHERARLFAAIAEVVLRDEADGSGGTGEPTEFAHDEVRAALVLTRRGADAVCGLAYDLVRRLPAVHAGMLAGRLDEPRARIFSQWTADLSDDRAHAVCAVLLPPAPGWTTGQLIEEIKRVAIAVDPGWARRRYEHAIRDRRVVGSRNPDGSANLCGYDLPVDQVAAACAHIDRLALAAKRAGHPDRIDHLRAELFLGMTDGRYTGLGDAAILARLLVGVARHSNDADRDHADAADLIGLTEDDRAGPDHATATDPVAHGIGQAGGSGDRAGGPPAHDDVVSTVDDESVEPAWLGPAAPPDPPAPPDPAARPTPAGSHRPGAAVPAPATPPAGPGVDLRVRLTTLLGHDAYPGELAGWGPVHAELAREIAAGQASGRWTAVVTDPDGHPIWAGPIRRRPTGHPATRRHGSGERTGPRGGVEIVVPEPTVLALATSPDPPDGWAGLVAEVRHRCDSRPAAPAGDPHARLPGAGLRRWIQTRDRTCVFPTCRVPAGHTDADHTVEPARGGPTADPNLGGVCRHDHRLRHEGGWLLRQVRPGHFVWVSRLGRIYPRRPPPALEPLPRPTAPSAEDGTTDVDLSGCGDAGRAEGSCMRPERPAPEPRAPAQRSATPKNSGGDIPPF